MEMTWIAIIASLFMGCGAVVIFIFAVKQDYFHDLEDTKYQVFWSDVEELTEANNSVDKLLPSDSAKNLSVDLKNIATKLEPKDEYKKDNC